MIKMAVGQQNLVEAFEPNPRPKDLALGAFAAVNQKAEFLMLNQ